jgi:hypothetical protein
MIDLNHKVGLKYQKLCFGIKNIFESGKKIDVSVVTDEDGWLTVTAADVSMRRAPYKLLVKAESLFDSKFTQVKY